MATLAGRCTQAAPDLRPSIRVAVVQLMTLASSTQEWDVESLTEDTPTAVQVQWVGISDTKIKISPFPDYTPLPLLGRDAAIWLPHMKEFSFLLAYSLRITRNFEWIYLMLRYIHYRCSVTANRKLCSKTTAFSPFTGCNFCGFIQKNWQPLWYFKSVPVGIVTSCVWI